MRVEEESEKADAGKHYSLLPPSARYVMNVVHVHARAHCATPVH